MLFIALGFGCASTSETLPSEIDVSLKEGEKICQTKKVLGTKIPEKFCYTKHELVCCMKNKKLSCFHHMIIDSESIVTFQT